MIENVPTKIPDEITAAERHFLTLWPSRETAECEGWVVRSNGGYSKRANSAVPLDVVGDRLVSADAIPGDVEDFFAHRGQPTILKLPRCDATAALEMELDARGYRRVDESIVLSRTVSSSDRFEAGDCEIDADPTEKSVGEVLSVVGVDEVRREAACELLMSIKRPVAIVRKRVGDSMVGCAVVAVDGPFAALFDVAVIPAYRRRGYAAEILSSAIAYASSVGASEVWLQVVAENGGARRLYGHAGFVEAYRYEYFIPDVRCHGSPGSF